LLQLSTYYTMNDRQKKSNHFTDNIEDGRRSSHKDRQRDNYGRSLFAYRMEVQITHFLNVPLFPVEKKVCQSDKPSALVTMLENYRRLYPKHTIVSKGPVKN
jgi:hypothetical protein